MKERYLPQEIINNPDAQIKHFNPEKGYRDRFGNRLITSKELAYLDGSGDRVKAGILISLEGQRFISENQGILKDIDHALAVLELTEASASSKIVDLGNNRRLQWVNAGGQSNFYILTVGENKYAIKTHTQRKTESSDIHQPYVNEMLQTQSLAADLKEELDFQKIQLSNFLFASGQVSCTKYEEDAKNYDALDRDRLEEIKYAALGYVIEQRGNQNPLWDNVNIDLPIGTVKGVVTALHNFRTKADGTLVWIDPFIYQRKEEGSKK